MQYVQIPTPKKREEIIGSIIYQIYEIAQVEEIEYPRDISYIMYKEDNFAENGLANVAKVIMRVGPTDFLVDKYSHNSVPEGKKDVVDFLLLDEVSGLRILSSNEFEQIRQSFNRTRRDILAACTRREEFLKKQDR
jgi:hypothetical protein